jgi:hypothetical protein
MLEFLIMPLPPRFGILEAPARVGEQALVREHLPEDLWIRDRRGRREGEDGEFLDWQQDCGGRTTALRALTRQRRGKDGNRPVGV